MKKLPPVSMMALSALLLAGSALGQSSPSGVDTSRADRRCPSNTLSSDPAASCSDDVLIDRPGVGGVIAGAARNQGGGQIGTGTPGPLPAFPGMAPTAPAGSMNAPASGSIATPSAAKAGAPAAGRATK